MLDRRVARATPDWAGGVRSAQLLDGGLVSIFDCQSDQALPSHGLRWGGSLLGQPVNEAEV